MTYQLENKNYTRAQHENCKFRQLITVVRVKLFLSFDGAPRDEGVLAEWRYSPMHS
jgi:hypothetical protein